MAQEAVLVCAHCKERKPEVGFHKSNRRSSGRQSWCKECMRSYQGGRRTPKLLASGERQKHRYEGGGNLLRLRRALEGCGWLTFRELASASGIHGTDANLRGVLKRARAAGFVEDRPTLRSNRIGSLEYRWVAPAVRDPLDGIDVPPLVDAAFGHWFAGISDGEAHFGIHKISGRRYLGRDYEPLFCFYTMRLRADDFPILQEIKDRLGFGRLVFNRQYSEDSERKPRWEFSVDTKPDCLVLAKIFQVFPLRAKKARDLQLWTDAIRVWHLRDDPMSEWYGSATWGEMKRLKEAIQAIRDYVPDYEEVG